MNRISSLTSPAAPAEAAWLGRWFTAARREGLLALLPLDAWHTLSALLSFTRRDGTRSFTVDQLAVAIGQSPEEAGRRLEHLTQIEWHGEPLARLEHDPAGAVVGVQLAPIDCLDRIEPPSDRPSTADPLDEPHSEGENRDLRPELEQVGLNPEQIESLLQQFPAARIRRQLAWLSRRQARNPAAFLIRAVEQDWGAPREGA